MKKFVALVAAGVAALAFWRRDTLKDDVDKVKEAATTTATRAKEKMRPEEEGAGSEEEGAGSVEAGSTDGTARTDDAESTDSDEPDSETTTADT